MKFDLGDFAIVNKNNPQGTPLAKGDKVHIIVLYPADFFGDDDSYKVEDVFGNRFRLSESHLSSDIELPVGLQLTFDLDSTLCDCGGYKTYNSMEPQFHSQTLPCTSLKK